MTDEEINKAIAEACGWKLEKNYWLTPEGCEAFTLDIPDYCNDLNEMHEVEKTLGDPAIRREYAYLLGRIVNGGIRFDAIHATARQRAEALLKTLGKCKEEQK